MRRRIPTMATLVAPLLVLTLTSPSAVAQVDQLANHRAVGTWLMDDGGVMVIHGDGTLSSFDAKLGVSFGSWVPTGRREVVITSVSPASAQGGVPARQAITRATARLTGEGVALDVAATIEIQPVDGEASGQLGPVASLGTRLLAEPPGEPLGPFPPEPVTE